jgi:hypothetical protein
LAADEDLFHALITCDHARRFWDDAQSWLDFSLPRLHPHTWSRDILCDIRFSDLDRAKIITLMWAIWNSRNNWTHDKGFFDPVQSMKMAKEACMCLFFPRSTPRLYLDMDGDHMMMMLSKLIMMWVCPWKLEKGVLEVYQDLNPPI